MQPIAVQIRRDTEANWNGTGTILRPGEQSYSTDTNVIKVGDGVSTWSALPPIGGGGGSSTSPLMTNNFMVAGGLSTAPGTALAYSYDGLTWVSSATDIFDYPGSYCAGLAWNGSIWVAAGYNTTDGIIASSPDGITWTVDLSGGSTPFSGLVVSALAWNGSLWVAGGTGLAGAAIATSVDGKTWIQRTSPFDVGIYTIAANGNMFVAAGQTADSNNIAYSYDGITWIKPNTSSIWGGPNGVAYSVAWNGRLWVAGGDDVFDNITIATSADGINWNQKPIESNTGTIFSVAWNGSIWMAVGQNNGTGCVFTSPNGSTWTDITANLAGNTPFQYISTVSWNGARWFIGGLDNTGTGTSGFLTSADTITWTPKNTYIGNDILTTASRRVLPYVGEAPVGPAGPLLSLSYYLSANTGANTGPNAISVIGFDTSDPANSVTGGILQMNYDKSSGLLTNTSNITISVLVSGQVTTDNSMLDLDRIQPCLYVTKNADNIVSSSAINFNGSSFSTIVVLAPAETISIRYSQTLPYDPVTDVSGVRFLGGQFSTRITFTQIPSSGVERSFPSIIRSSLIPDMPSTYDLGSTGFPFHSLHVTGTTIYLGSASIKESGGSISLINADGSISYGPTGPAGPGGSTSGTPIIYETGVPLGTIGNIGDTYIQTNVAIMYSKVPTITGWAELTAATAKTWVSVASSADGQYLYALAYSGYIHINNNFGDGAWEEIEIDDAPAVNLTSVACSGSGQLVAVSGANSFIYVNNAYGQGEWNISNVIQNTWNVTVSSDGGLVIGVSDTGLVAKSDNLGTTWTYTSLTYGATFADMLFNPAGTALAYIAMSTNEFIYYNDASYWYRISSKQNYTTVKLVPTFSGAPSILRTTQGMLPVEYSNDLGNTWNDISGSEAHIWTSIANSAVISGVNKARIFMVASDDPGFILYGAEGAEGDFNIIANPDSSLGIWSSISCNLAGTHVALTDQAGYIYYSANNSVLPDLTWLQSDISGATWTCVAMAPDYYLDSYSILVTARDVSGGIYLKSDETNHFAQITTTSTSNMFTSVTMCGTAGSYGAAAVGINDYVYVSVDGALATWTDMSGFGKHDMVSITSHGDNQTMRLLATDTSGNVWYSADLGVSWNISSPSPTFSSVSSSSDGTILVATDAGSQITDGSGYIWKSSDSGQTWAPNYESGLRQWRCISSSPSGVRIAAAAANDGDVYLTLNGGDSWSPIGPRTGNNTTRWNGITFGYDSGNDKNIIGLVTDNSGVFIYDGTAWTQPEGSGERPWNCITSSSDGSRILAGESVPNYPTDGYLYRYGSNLPWNTKINIGSVALYNPANPLYWVSPLPVTIKEALDRLAYGMTTQGIYP